MSNAHQRFAPAYPDYTEREGGEAFINDTGVSLRLGDIFQVRGANATSGVSTTTDLGETSWLYRASVVEFMAAGTERKKLHGRFRVVTSTIVAPGAQGRCVGEMPCKALIKLSGTADAAVPADSAVVPVTGAVNGVWDVTIVGNQERKVIAITLFDAVIDDSGNALVPCIIDGDRGFGMS